MKFSLVYQIEFSSIWPKRYSISREIISKRGDKYIDIEYLQQPTVENIILCWSASFYASQPLTFWVVFSILFYWSFLLCSYFTTKLIIKWWKLWMPIAELSDVGGKFSCNNKIKKNSCLLFRYCIAKLTKNTCFRFCYQNHFKWNK